MENQEYLMIENTRAAYAVLSTISEFTKTKSLCEKKLVSLLKGLNIGELKLLASRRVIEINLDCERLSREMGVVKKIVEKQKNQEQLIALGAPFNLMRYLGMSEREYRQCRKTLDVSCQNRNRPKMATDEDIEKISKHIHILFSGGVEKEKALLQLQKKSGVSVSRIWQHIKHYPQFNSSK